MVLCTFARFFIIIYFFQEIASLQAFDSVFEYKVIYLQQSKAVKILYSNGKYCFYCTFVVEKKQLFKSWMKHFWVFNDESYWNKTGLKPSLEVYWCKCINVSYCYKLCPWFETGWQKMYFLCIQKLWMAFNFQNLEIFLLSLIINDNPGKNIYELDIKSTKKYKKIQKTLSTLIKCITKKKLVRKKIIVLAGLMK